MPATFHAEAEGNPPEISWHWQGSPTGAIWDDLEDSEVYGGTQTDSLEILFPDVSLNGWWYRAVASNGFLTVTSGSAMLTITGA